MNPEEEMVVVEEEVLPEITEEIDSSSEDEKDKAKKPKRRGSDGNPKRGNDNQKRINDLWLARKEAEAAAAKQAQRAEAESARSAEYEKITAAALEDGLKTKRELLTERLLRAQESEDNKAVAKITAELTKVEAEAATIERYKIENQITKSSEPKAPKQEVQEPLSFDDLYENMGSIGKKWIDDNRAWYDPSSEDHDPEMTQDVTYYATMLDNNFNARGVGFPPGSKAYFKQIDDYIKQNWSDAVEEEKQEEPKKIHAAPLGSRSNPSNPNPQRKEYKISQAEKELALSLDTKGKDGKPLSDNDKIKRFISLRESTPQSGPISMTTMKKGS